MVGHQMETKIIDLGFDKPHPYMAATPTWVVRETVSIIPSVPTAFRLLIMLVTYYCFLRTYWSLERCITKTIVRAIGARFFVYRSSVGPLHAQLHMRDQSRERPQTL